MEKLSKLKSATALMGLVISLGVLSACSKSNGNNKGSDEISEPSVQKECDDKCLEEQALKKALNDTAVINSMADYQVPEELPTGRACTDEQIEEANTEYFKGVLALVTDPQDENDKAYDLNMTGLKSAISRVKVATCRLELTRIVAQKVQSVYYDTEEGSLGLTQEDRRDRISKFVQTLGEMFSEDSKLVLSYESSKLENSVQYQINRITERLIPDVSARIAFVDENAENAECEVRPAGKGEWGDTYENCSKKDSYATLYETANEYIEKANEALKTVSEDDEMDIKAKFSLLDKVENDLKAVNDELRSAVSELQPQS